MRLRSLYGEWFGSDSARRESRSPGVLPAGAANARLRCIQRKNLLEFAAHIRPIAVAPTTGSQELAANWAPELRDLARTQRPVLVSWNSCERTGLAVIQGRRSMKTAGATEPPL